MPNWTEAQKSAIEARNSDILVSAAAGSGKTAVLVERVIKKITDANNPVDIDKMLIVTFTNAAAQEMKARISKALQKILQENPNDTNAIKQLSLLPNAKISTIDSFCSNLVRENFHMLDIQQDFTVLDDAQALLVEDNAINQIVDELYQNNEQEFKSLVELLSNAKNDKGFISAIKRLNEYIMVQAFPYEWLDNLAEAYNPNSRIEDSIFAKHLLNELNNSLNFIYQLLRDSYSKLSVDDDLYDALIDILNADKLCFDRIKEAVSWNDIVKAVSQVDFVTMTRKSGKHSAKAEIAENRDLYKGVFNRDIKPIFVTTEEDFIDDNKILYPNVKLLSQIVKRYNSQMMEIKKELNAYKFSDIEHFAIQLLFFKDENGNIVKTDLAKEYCDNFDEILVDEYQDTNFAQDMLFEMLSNGHNRFMVGDVKQSIYRFRLAMPQIFTDKKNSFDSYPTENSTSQKIILDKNFRSRSGICEYTNFIFSNLMSEEVGELEYSKEEYLNNGAEYTDSNIPSAQIHISTLPEEENQDEYEAKQVASLILNKIASKEQIKCGDTYRDIQFEDFAILFRAASSRMPIFKKILTEYGIPVIANNKLNLFDTNEVSILISLLKVIDNPTLDIPLLSTLLSVFYGYTADDISKARINHKAKNLYGSISKDDNFNAIINDIDKYKKYASSMSVECLIRQIISETSYLSVISAMGNGEQRRLNVMKLIDIAKNYDNGENVGLTAFLRYVDCVISSGINVEGANVSYGSANAVNLMTIHKSKGLEFPICILAGANHRYNTDEQKNLIQLNATYGIGLKVHNEEELYRYNSLQYHSIKNINSVASMSENLRVLYVAITRAKEQFITFYTDKNPQKHIQGLSKKIVHNRINPAIIKHISSDADLILLTAMLHKDGSLLRNEANKNILPDMDFDFDMLITYTEEIEEASQKDVQPADYDEGLVEQISKKLSFSYERKELSGFSSLRVASQLDSKNHGFEFLATSKPSFLNKTGLTPAEKGTAMHEFMQYCDYRLATQNLEEEIQRLVNTNKLSEIQAKSLDRRKLSNLFSSSIAKRMIEADKLYREIKVASFVKVSELEATEYDDKVMVQGIADCVFEENGELVLVDYKTDRIDSSEELLERYKNQISFYKTAIEKTLEKPVKEALLYSFWLNKECNYNLF